MNNDMKAQHKALVGTHTKQAHNTKMELTEEQCVEHVITLVADALLAEMSQGIGCPCFKAGPNVLQGLRKRFKMELTEEQCVEHVLTLVADALDAWSTRQYDFYQRLLNGIL